jgi:predicted nucleic acid-binding protein
MAVWDTSVASGLHPDAALFEVASQAALSGEPILLAAPTVAEISFGLQRRADDERFAAALAWFTNILDAGLLGVLPLSREAALLAGRLRAVHPTPPSATSGRGKRDGRAKPERRVAWVADIQIAATAWLAAEPLCTADQGHFGLLGSAIVELYPREGGLEILPSPV